MATTTLSDDSVLTESNVQVAKASSGSSTSALKSFLSGGVGGIAAVVVGHPFDLIKVRMQTGTAGGGSVFGIMRQTLVHEGIRGLYRGVSAPLVAVSPIYAVSFWGYDIGQKIVRFGGNLSSEVPLSLVHICLAGGISALPTTAIMAPTERIKCLLQVQSSSSSSKPQYAGMTDCAKQVLRTGGLPSLYKGTILTLARDVPGSIAWFGVYEIMKQKMIQWQGITDPSQLSPVAVMIAGGFAGMACWGCSIPADVLKSRFQTAPDGKYRNIAHVYTSLIKEEGYGALFTGIRPAMIRAFPANAACFLGMEVSKQALSFLD